MSVQVEELGDSNVLQVRVTGKLTSGDYDSWVSFIDRKIREEGKVRILFLMEEFHGWTPGALWEDLKFDVKHFSLIERLAMVGERRWQEGMSWFCKPFTKARIRYFPREEAERAREWLMSDVRIGSSE